MAYRSISQHILALIEGRKLVFLVNPKESKRMYPSNKYEPGSRLSDVNMEDFNADKHSMFKDANVQFTIINPNEMLFIPQTWWHCVYGLDISISSNNFAFTPFDNFKMKSTEFTKRVLHNAGLLEIKIVFVITMTKMESVKHGTKPKPVTLKDFNTQSLISTFTS